MFSLATGRQIISKNFFTTNRCGGNVDAGGQRLAVSLSKLNYRRLLLIQYMSVLNTADLLLVMSTKQSFKHKAMCTSKFSIKNSTFR